MHIGTNIGKSFLLATGLFWGLNLELFIADNLLAFAVFSIIPIFIITALTIVFTIAPFFWLGLNKTNNYKKVYSVFFPFYAITAFTLLMILVVSSNFLMPIIAFSVSAFITTSTSWLWFSRQ